MTRTPGSKRRGEHVFHDVVSLVTDELRDLILAMCAEVWSVRCHAREAKASWRV